VILNLEWVVTRVCIADVQEGNSQTAIFVFFPAATGTGSVTGDFERHLDDVVWFSGFSDEPVVLFNPGNPILIHQVVDQ